MTQTTLGGNLEGQPVDRPADAPDQLYRAGAYAYLAALLRAEPDDALLASVAGLKSDAPESGGIDAALTTLAMAAANCLGQKVREEYFDLFIGLGRGELVPYGSWYQTGFLMEKPLGVLRDDLMALGFERDSNTREPEDHVAALFEVMNMLIRESYDLDQQKAFFERHLSSWISRFFEDMSNAQSATFYRSVARFGKEFTEFEKQYLGMPV